MVKKTVYGLLHVLSQSAQYFLDYAYQAEELVQKCDRMADCAWALCREVEGDRRTVTRVIAKSPLATVGFWALDHQEQGRMWLERQTIGTLMKYIPEYKCEGIVDLL